jgi:hypothetical protein
MWVRCGKYWVTCGKYQTTEYISCGSDVVNIRHRNISTNELDVVNIRLPVGQIW